MQKKLMLLSVLVGLLAAVPAEAVKVFRTTSEGLADVKVYETSSEGLADCLIYVTSSEGLASGDAKWFFESSEGLADVKIYFTSSEGLADKKIYFTKSEGLAKCGVDWKGYKKSSVGYLARSLDALQFPTDALMRRMVLVTEPRTVVSGS
jgi:Family of unknown function (DUF6150)